VISDQEHREARKGGKITLKTTVTLIIIHEQIRFHDFCGLNLSSTNQISNLITYGVIWDIRLLHAYQLVFLSVKFDMVLNCYYRIHKRKKMEPMTCFDIHRELHISDPQDISRCSEREEIYYILYLFTLSFQMTNVYFISSTVVTIQYNTRYFHTKLQLWYKLVRNFLWTISSFQKSTI